jgi:DNA-directed RNA polymerase subunit RPC12/RpoP
MFLNNFAMRMKSWECADCFHEWNHPAEDMEQNCPNCGSDYLGWMPALLGLEQDNNNEEINEELDEELDEGMLDNLPAFEEFIGEDEEEDEEEDDDEEEEEEEEDDMAWLPEEDDMAWLPEEEDDEWMPAANLEEEMMLPFAQNIQNIEPIDANEEHNVIIGEQNNGDIFHEFDNQVMPG